MKNGHQKKKGGEYSILTPWETQVQDTAIDKYCTDFINSFNPTTTTQNNQSKTNPKKRAHSTRNTKALLAYSQKINFNPAHSQPQNDNYIHNNHTMSQIRSDRVEKKRPESRAALQELNVKTFVMDGVQAGQKACIKRQSTYAMKQKFGEFRRSGKTAQSNKENFNGRLIRYQC